MGYYISQDDQSFTILNKNIPLALKALRKYGSVPEDNDKNDEEAFYSIMSDYCWETEIDENGNVVKIDFCGENLWDDFKIFQTIAPYVENDSFIEMHGEDGRLWRWFFKNGECKEIEPKIIWETT